MWICVFGIIREINDEIVILYSFSIGVWIGVNGECIGSDDYFVLVFYGRGIG